MSITINSNEIREVLNQVVNDPEYKQVSKVPLLSIYQIGLLLLAYGGYVLGILSYFYLSAPLWLIIPMMGFCSYLAFTPLHDSTHQAASSNKTLNAAIGTIAAFLLFPLMLSSVYKFLHMTHHRYVGDDELDPDAPLVSLPTRYYPFGYLFLLVFDMAWLYWLFTKGWDRMSTRVRAATCFSMFGFITFNVVWFTGPYWFEYLMLFHLPTRIGQLYTAYTFAHIQHPDGVKWDEFPFESTYVLKERKHFLLRSLLGQEQHALHHFLPHVPWYKYKKVWDLGNGIFTRLQIPERSVLAKPDFTFKQRLEEQEESEPVNLWVKISEVKEETTEIKSFDLVNASNEMLPEFTAGAHIRVKLPSGKIRSYSLINSPHERSRYQIAVKKDQHGNGGSIEMHQLNVGDQLEISPPKNNFVLYENVKRYILISGGIGITPLLSMAHRLDALEKRFEFHICVQSKEALPFLHELSHWPFAPMIEVHYDKKGKPSIALDRVLSHPGKDSLIYCCGPSGLNQLVKSYAIEHGWEPSQIKQELFAVDQSTNKAPESFDLELRKSGKTITIPADRTIIDMVELVNVPVKYACLQGTCGSCITDVISGEVDHRDAVLSEAEKLSNKKICLCVSRARNESLVIDL